MILGLVSDLMYVVFIYLFFSCPWSPTSAPHSQVKAWLGPAPQEKDGPSPSQMVPSIP